MTKNFGIIYNRITILFKHGASYFFFFFFFYGTVHLIKCRQITQKENLKSENEFLIKIPLY